MEEQPLPSPQLLPAASCSALSAQPLAGAWTALSHAACNMFLLKIIVVINALSFSTAICLDASHSGCFPRCSPKLEGEGQKGQRQLLAPSPAPLLQLRASSSAVVPRPVQGQQEAPDFLRVKEVELGKRHAWKEIHGAITPEGSKTEKRGTCTIGSCLEQFWESLSSSGPQEITRKERGVLRVCISSVAGMGW